MNFKKLGTVIGALACFTSSAFAEDKGWYIQAGVASVSFDESANLTAAGGAVPGANVSISTEQAFGLGIGYFFNPNFSMIGLIGTPPTSTITGTGTVAGLSVGEVTYGPAILAANYHFTQFGKFQPFVGAGVSYSIIFDQNDGAVQNLSVDNAFGGVLRVGFDYLIDDHQGIFFSANKVFADTTLTGTVAPGVPGFGGAPVSANVGLDPLILHAGYTYRW